MGERPAIFEGGERVGRFVIVRLIGAGGMGEVYEARDHELARSVALKIMPGAVQPLRLMREGQALAQLQHPNVVGVHGLEVHDGRLCIAMELVSGETLDRYIERARPTWREIVALFVQAGRGLAAAHAKGIVHRDVKPSNLLVDDTGRVRVGDFGLARQIDGDDDHDGIAPGRAEPRALAETVDDASPAASAASPAITRTGALVGTPLYMAPEQHLGRHATPATDQFAFCVALWTALFGGHPFDIERGVSEAVLAGARASPPRRRRVPRWLVRTLDRGLAAEPGDRYPSMTALTDRLDTVPRRRRAAVMIAAGALVIGGVVAWEVARGGDASGPPCPEPAEQIAAVWGPERAGALATRLAAIDPVRGRDRAAAITRASDAFVAGWRAARTDACAATRIRGEQSDQMLDARMRCLRGRLAELDAALGRALAARDATAADTAAADLLRTAPPASCADASALATDLAFPLAAPARAAADAVQGELHQLAGTPAVDALPRARGLLVRARALAHPPTLARSLAAVAEIELEAHELAPAERTLRELTQVAAAAHADRDEAYAWIKLVEVVGGNIGKPVEGLALAAAARAAIARAGQPLDLRSDLLYAEAMVLGTGPDTAQALSKLEEARQLLERAGAASPTSAYHSRLADVWYETGNARAAAAQGGSGSFDDAVAAYRRSIELVRAQFGPDSPAEAFAWHGIAEASNSAGKLDQAREAALAAVKIREARTGESLMLATSLVTLGTAYGNAEAWRDALAAYDHALAIFRAHLAPTDVQLSSVLLGRAWVLGALGREPEALEGYAEVIALFDRAKASAPDLAIALFNRAHDTEAACATTPAPAAALADYTRSAAVFERHMGADAPVLAEPLSGRGRCLMLARQPGEAVAPLERALALAERGSAMALVIQHWLGRALIASGRDPARGATLVRDARAQLTAAARTDKDAAAKLAELDRQR